MDKKQEWNERYREGKYHADSEPLDLLKRWLPYLSKGKALDVACGAGENAIFLAENDYSVDAIDYSEEALKIARQRSEEKNLEVNWIESNFNNWKPTGDPYDLVLVSHFHPQDNMSRVKGAIREGGYIIYEHHLQTEKKGMKGPQSPEFLFEPNQLLEIFSDFQTIYFQEGIETHKNKDKAALVKLVAKKVENKEELLPFPKD